MSHAIAATSPSEFTQLRHRVKAAGLLEPQPGYYILKLALHMALFGLVLGAVILGRSSPWCVLGALPLALLNVQLGMLSHDAGHQAIFRSKQANLGLGVVSGALLGGMSAGWWRTSHNAHHAASGHEDKDPDLQYACFAFNRAQADRIGPRFRPILKRQHLLALPLMMLVAFNVRIYSVAWLWRHPSQRADALAMALFFIWYGALLVFVLPPATALAFFLLHQALCGLYLGLITSPNHWGMPMRRDDEPTDFLYDQVRTSRNIVGGPWVTYLFGGLDVQVEHHLFPRMPRNRLRAAVAIVRPFCLARGLPYHAVSPTEAYAEMYRNLREMARYAVGAAAEPPSAPLG